MANLPVLDGGIGNATERGEKKMCNVTKCSNGQYYKEVLAVFFTIFLSVCFVSCETAQQKNARLQKEERQRTEKAEYDRYINNRLPTGDTPYETFYGGNRRCSSAGCSQITVQTPANSDVLVTIKKDGNVVRHAYIRAAGSYTFELPNGVYQPFFYYGKGWNPDKAMKETPNGTLKGGFVAEEAFGKDTPQALSDNILTYELILQKNGNFSTRPSNAQDAL
jgi:hypothetical protein